MKTLRSVIILGAGFLLCAGSPARAQYGDMGDAMKKGAGDAVKQEVMKGAGLPAAPAPAAAPAAAPDAGGAAAGGAAAGQAKPAADAAGAPAGDTGAGNAPAGD